MARPVDLNPKLAAALVKLIEDGLPLSKAAEHEGISYRTLCRWMKRSDGPFAEFCLSIKKAKAIAQKQMIDEIRAGVDNWQARAWYLERSDPKNWGRKDKLQAVLKTQPEKMSDEELWAKVEKLREERMKGVH